MGEIALALRHAAAVPGTSRDLAVRAQVGFDAARKTASRMVARGELVRLHAGRPAVLVCAQALSAQPSARDLDDGRPLTFADL